MQGSASHELNLFIEVVRKIGNHETIKAALFENSNWAKILEYAKQHKVFPILYSYLKGFISIDARQDWDDAFYKHKSSINDQLEVLEEVVGILSKHPNIPFLAMKGITLSKLIYEDIYMRNSNDIDLLFRECDLNKVFDILSDHGYFSVVGDPYPYGLEEGKALRLPYPIFKQNDHHEYGEMWKKKSTGFIAVELQRYIHSTIKDLNIIDRILEYNQLIQLKKNAYPTFDLSHTLMILCENAYFDLTYSRRPITLRHYLDIALFIKKFKTSLDWESITSLVNDYGIGFVMIQSLNYVNEFFGNIVAKDTINSFMPKNTINKWRHSLFEMLYLSHQEFKKEFMYNKISYFQNKEDLPEITPHKDLTAYKDLNSYLQSTLSTDKFDLNIRYLIINKDEEINFYIYFENIALQYFHDNPFLIAFLNSNEEDERLILSLDMGWDRENNKLWGKWNDGEQSREWEIPVIEIDDHKVIKVVLPLSKINNSLVNDKIYFKYSIWVKQIYNIHHFYDVGIWENYTDFVDRCSIIRLS
ncbi:Uncharacterised nucleotidyltransferase [Paenibacillus sp. cl141a]|uniref:nucleotidyltransferase family protein n=1 Tax=Paenibacillus sp. cl141a TaxID=1761877 RepID=UPI0008BD45A6|nr:nucleotidyltransferase family protein [Paenibacillus sp. cl141a]SEM54890.1 Uncharacterised nucleotidyltransferase [Paenibacillus sp. cl141a]